MPYQYETANKIAHGDFVRNPEVAAFLQQCTFLRIPSDDECASLAARFAPAPVSGETIPRFVMAFDGSAYESSINDRLPATRVGYVKIGAVLINLNEYEGLRVGGLVDPFRVAALQDSSTPLTFMVPSANVTWAGHQSVQHSFRALLDQQLSSVNTRFRVNDPSTSLRATLFELAARRPEPLGTGDPHKLRLHECPECHGGPVDVLDDPMSQLCPHCGAPIYASDCLRLWETMEEYQSNRETLGRLMMVLEHLLPIHYMRYLRSESLGSLSSVSFFVDGPLAIFGSCAWLHRPIMAYLYEVNQELMNRGYPGILVIGLQKSGQVVDHVSLIEKYLPNQSILPIDDDYRYSYVLPGRTSAQNGFGSETYYGQDFILRTATGKSFVFAVPYPWQSKESVADFGSEKAKVDNYASLGRAVELIEQLETDLYRNAVVPIALAHKYTAISLKPGGSVLDLLTRRALGL